ncbi:Cof-type HAD-IIB family hydrolase [Tannockella kyphosi]|uniref:Cof-type HAD-IIB family hydrolase n=1 Tax=Tannockella kyphosi TaxID=2899121 RepID=UPI002013C087|nr:Cof-type HAD-IIB family hydrolase [Tannockella kyphosi]
MIKLIATDMDGTFLDSNKNYDPKFLELFKKMKEKNIHFVVASGNQCHRLFQRFESIKEDIYYIAENGSYTLKGSTPLYSTLIAPEDLNKLLDMLLPLEDCFFILSGRKGTHILNKHRNREDIIVKYYARYYFVENYDDLDDEIFKISLYDDNHQSTALLETILPSIPKDVRAITTGHEWIDFTDKSIHKGIALKKLQDDLGILPEECAAFGDQMNDLELLQQVKYSYAMDNAVDPIKEVAYEIIGDNDSQAVIKKIEEILNNV